MPSRVQRACVDALVSAGVLAIVLGVLVSIDVRVREQIQAAVAAASPATAADAGARLREVAAVLLDAVRTQSVDYGPLMIFVVIATLLLLAMTRT